jgi:catechol 2,3-dioxygenase-like lactoylglutathione lyase family enzyme
MSEMTMRLEVVPLAVSDVDRSIGFYRNGLGFVLDHDVRPGGAMRVVQLTPPGSSCSIVFGVGVTDATVAPGSTRGLHLVVEDIDDVVQALRGRAVDVGDVIDMGGVKYAHLADPDGNTWALQQLRTETPGSAE